MAGTPQSAEKDCEIVARAAQLLEVSEYELFLRAYRTWHHEVPDQRRIETQFAACMFGNSVPYWARDYARKILLADAQVSPQPSSPATWLEALRFAGALIASAGAVTRDDPRRDFELSA